MCGKCQKCKDCATWRQKGCAKCKQCETCKKHKRGEPLTGHFMCFHAMTIFKFKEGVFYLKNSAGSTKDWKVVEIKADFPSSSQIKEAIEKKETQRSQLKKKFPRFADQCCKPNDIDKRYDNILQTYENNIPRKSIFLPNRGYYVKFSP